jgi:homoserine kinase
VIWSEHPARVRVPATSANLGPGFDALGLALTLYDEVEARVTDGGLSVAVSGEGEETAAAPEQHLVVRAMRAAFGAMSGQPPGLALRCVNAIPHGRGLGSSAAAVVSGVLAARALVAGGADLLPDEDMLALAVELEGHPDNVAACLAGGLTVAWHRSVAGRGDPVPGTGVFRGESGEPGVEDSVPGTGVFRGGPGEPGVDAPVPGAGVVRGGPGGAVGVLRLPVLDSLSAVACVAPTALATREARRVLPELVPHADAAANAARSALLVAGLTRDPAVLFDATEDFLHQRYRAPVMPETADLLGRLRRAGVAAVVSGAGPSILAMIVAGQLPGPEVVDSIAGDTGITWAVIPLDVDRQGPAIQPQPGAQLIHTRQGRSFNQAPGPGIHPAGWSPQGRVARSATHGPLSGECRGLLWC